MFAERAVLIAAAAEVATHCVAGRLAVVQVPVERLFLHASHGGVPHVPSSRSGSTARCFRVGTKGSQPAIPGAAPLGLGQASLHLSACLLYTSPSPRDRTRSRMPSSA